MVLVPRHGTSPLGCCALWHGMTLSEGFSAMPGPESRHGGTTRHGTTVTPCLIVPCRVVLVPCSASAARLENYTPKPGNAKRLTHSLCSGGLLAH